jgi:hypothetical protein
MIVGMSRATYSSPCQELERSRFQRQKAAFGADVDAGLEADFLAKDSGVQRNTARTQVRVEKLV